MGEIKINHFWCRSLGDKCERRTFSVSQAGSFWICVFIYPQYCTISCSDNVAADLWGINVSDEYFLVRWRVIFGDVFLFIPNIAQFSFVRKKKTERQTYKQFKLNCKKKKGKRKKKKEKKGKKRKREKGKGK